MLIKIIKIIKINLGSDKSTLEEIGDNIERH
jgi:hypothetical protein